MRCILVILDGLGDRPIPKFKNLTPLEIARTPNLDKLAQMGITGLMNTIKIGVTPGSDTSHLSILGYEPEKYYCGRGPLEALGINLYTKPNELVFRGNIATVDEELNIIDRRAGRINSNEMLVGPVNGLMINKIRFNVFPALGHRVIVVAAGKNLSDKISDNDIHKEGTTGKPKTVLPLDNSKSAKFTADVINKFTDKAHKLLNESQFNRTRKYEGLIQANYILLRGAGFFKKIESFEEKFGLKAACIAGGNLYKGIARYLGMDVLEAEGATGLPNTNVDSKINLALESLKHYDFIFVHIKAADTLSEDGNFIEKKKFIEKADKAFKPLLKLKDTLIVVTADHSTSCALKKHTADPVPILMAGEGIRTDSVKRFSERNCALGGLGRIKGLDVMPEIINIMGRSILYGD